MIIEWKSEYIGHIGFKATPGDYDGIPRLESLWLDAAPKTRHPDREAVAAFLVFGSYMGGLTQMPHKFSPAVEVVMRDLAGEVSAAFAPVEYYPKALPAGGRTLHLSWTGDSTGAHEPINSEADSFLVIDRSDSASGSMRWINGLRVASNAWLHSRPELGELKGIYPFIATAVLYAEDLGADTIQIAGKYDTQSDDWKGLVRLLGAARLGLRCIR